MATKRMPWIVLAAVMGISLMAGSAFAEDHAYNFNDEVKKGDERAGFTLKVLVKEPTYTVGAVAVKDEIKAHIHKDGDHVLYIVSGQGSMMHGTQTIALKPGMVVHVPKGEVHAIKAQGGELTLLDFAQPPFSPDQMEWVK
jgi:mannose-6-phosphate isomerase-like protein (cupin superfamily)